MTKVRRERSPYMNRSESYPYPPPISRNLELPKPNLGSADEMKEWDDTICPICMEIPHNTVLLKCSSYEMGCRPYMCNTSYRHSNCLDQFCKSFDSLLSSAVLEEIPLTSTASHDSKVQSEPGNPSQCGSQLQPKLVCPLCRGGIYGYMVSEPARSYMNCKPRSCSSEKCEYQGTYPELRKHARLEHPFVRPAEVDPLRQGDWYRMEQERDFEDLLSSINASSGAEISRGDSILSGRIADVLSTFLREIFTSTDDATLMSRLVSDLRPRMPLHDRRSETMHRVWNDTPSQSARWRSSLPSTHQVERIHRDEWRTNLSASRDREAYRTAGSRPNTPQPSRMSRSRTAHNNYYRELSLGVRTSSTRMSRVSQVSQTNPQSNNSLSRRISGSHLRWRNHRWSTFDGLP